jgi:gamma-glutamyltranspeptidase
MTDVHYSFQNLTRLASQKTADKIRANIDDNKTYGDPSHYGEVIAEGMKLSTSHISVVDEDGNAVSTTASINLQ